MRKILFIITVLIITSIVIFLFVLFQGQPTTNIAPTPTPTPIELIPQTEKLEISDTEVDNFYKNAERIDQQRDVYIADEPNQYQILFMEKYNQFLISILGSPFEAIRTAAEQRLLSELGVSEADACDLDVTITTPTFANPDYSGKPYKLSFCE